jgi:poly-gamma-glutamate synthesis protein (capsule biosynthesis protein)
VGSAARLAAWGAGAVLVLAIVPGDIAARGARAPSLVAGGRPHTPASADAPATAPPTTAPPPPPTFTLVATGDVLLHTRLWEQAAADAAAAGGAGFDFRPLLAGVAPVVAGADLALCHMETPIAPAGGPYASYPSFSVPPEIAPALAATGYDACSTASNHTYDRGAAGVDRTLAALDAAGIRHTGSARTAAEAGALTILDAGPARVGYLSYTYGFNGIPAPNGQQWRANPIDQGRILADAARARAAGADVVVVALHWGDEYRAEPNAQQQALAPALVRSPDIDLVLGHHAHVVQPLEWVDGEWIVYGMGNEVALHGTGFPPNQEGLMVRFTFTGGPGGWRATRAEYEPLLVSRVGPLRVLDVGAALAHPQPGGPGTPRLREAWDRTAAVVASRGAMTRGLRPITPAP